MQNENNDASINTLICKKMKNERKKKTKKKKELKICLANCRYELVKRSALKFGFKEVDEKDDWNLYWTDLSVCVERVMDMKRFQKINHFPGMTELCRKDLLARNLSRMQKLFPKDYNFFPKSWCLPADYSDFLIYTKENKNQTFILKPEAGCQGKGIWITKNISKINPQEHKFCQRYISKPFLIDGYKFDLRVYVLVTSCDPFRIFVYNEGLARFATIKYEMPSINNHENLYMHLTNYSINKGSVEFNRNDVTGSKRKLSTLNNWFEMNGHNPVEIWNNIDDVIIKTLVSVHSSLSHNYRTCFPYPIKGGCACFEILGFDIVLDRKLNPFVLEVNHSPSFFTDSSIDREVKDALIFDTLCLINFHAISKKQYEEEEKEKIKNRLFINGLPKENKEKSTNEIWENEVRSFEDKHMMNFRRIYPNDSGIKYTKFLQTNFPLYQETNTYKERVKWAKKFRSKLNGRQKLNWSAKYEHEDHQSESSNLFKLRKKSKSVSYIKPVINKESVEESDPALDIQMNVVHFVETSIHVNNKSNLSKDLKQNRKIMPMSHVYIT